VYCSGAGALTVVDANGSAPLYLATTALTADYGGVPALSQFGLAITVALNHLPSYQEFTNLFERYKITKLTVKITPQMGDSYNAATGSAIPTINSVLDFTDSTPPVSQDAVNQYESLQTQLLTVDKPFSRSCCPKPASSMYVSAVNSGYSSTSKHDDIWLDCTAPSNAAPHYGMKFWVRNFFTGAAGGGIAFRISPFLEFALREPH